MTKRKNETFSTYSAPDWAWDIIFETIALDGKSPAFDEKLRNKINDAFTTVEYVGEG